MVDPAAKIRNCGAGGIILYAQITILDSFGKAANGQVVRKVTEFWKRVGHIATIFQLLQE